MKLWLMEVSTLPVLLKKSMMPAPGLRDAEPLNGGLPPPGSIHAAGSWMAPAQADAASHTSIPHVAIKRLMNILRRLSDAAHFSYGYSNGRPESTQKTTIKRRSRDRGTRTSGLFGCFFIEFPHQLREFRGLAEVGQFGVAIDFVE